MFRLAAPTLRPGRQILRTRAPEDEGTADPAELTAGEYGWVWQGERKLVRDVARDELCSDRTE
jgi:hypothetical protein